MERGRESGFDVHVGHQLPGGSSEGPKVNLIRRDWEDDYLPPNVETFSFNARFKRYKRYGDDPNGLIFSDLDGISFGIPKEKLDSVDAGQGDELRVEKLVSDGTYHGDGIVKITNITKGLSATINDWDHGSEKEHYKRAA